MSDKDKKDKEKKKNTAAKDDRAATEPAADVPEVDAPAVDAPAADVPAADVPAADAPAPDDAISVAPAATASAPQIGIQSQYVKDLSFENPGAPGSLVGADTPSTVVAQASGWVEPDPYPIYVTALSDGVIEKLLVLEGDKIEADQVIAEMVDDDARLAFCHEVDEKTRKTGDFKIWNMPERLFGQPNSFLEAE